MTKSHKQALKRAISNRTSMMTEVTATDQAPDYPFEHQSLTPRVKRKAVKVGRPTAKCISCQLDMELESFRIQRHLNGRDYRDSRCNECRRIACICRNLAITREEYNEILGLAKGKCRLCGESGRLSIDHCHSTGKLRGAICTRCNTGLGQFRDDPELLLMAVAYVEYWRKAHAAVDVSARDTKRAQQMAKMRRKKKF